MLVLTSFLISSYKTFFATTSAILKKPIKAGISKIDPNLKLIDSFYLFELCIESILYDLVFEIVESIL